MAKGKSTRELVSSITGKGTTMTAKALVNVKLDLERKIIKLLAKDKLTETEKLRLKNTKEQLRDVKAELSEESSKAGRSMNQAARDAKMKKRMAGKQNPLIEDMEKALGKLDEGEPKLTYKDKEKLQEILKKQEAGAKPKKMKRGGMMKTGHMDYRKGGMFYS